MQDKQKFEKWWLVSILAQVFTFGTGFFCAFLAPPNQDDWLGARFIAPVVFGLIAGSIIACIAAAISFVRGEEKCIRSLISAVPGVIILALVICVAVQVHDSKKQMDAIKALQQEEVKKTTAEIRANPDLILNEDFWRTHSGKNGEGKEMIFYALINDRVVPLQDEVKYKILNHYIFRPDPSEQVFMFLSNGQHLTKDDLEKIIVTCTKNPYVVHIAEEDLRREHFQKSSPVH